MKPIYTSTRSDVKVSPSLAILKGISDDGGLYVPQSFPSVNIEDLKNSDYNQLCFNILSNFLYDIDSSVLMDMIHKAYSKFNVKEVTPISSFDNYNILELFHGPTLAFKDVALSILPYLMMESASIQNVHDEIVILTATSGDTGKAALEGFADVNNSKIIVFYPSEGVSEVQKKQMISQAGSNVYVIGIQGNFDDAQNGVKKIFNDIEFKKYLKGKNIILSSANSINIGRLLPQIVYYFSAYMQLVQQKKIKMNESVNFTVPTGNFGNILAGYYAQKMGLPINKLICASNANNVLYEFFSTGKYDKNRNFIKTISPSMDILISSNFERLIYHISENDYSLVKNLMNGLSSSGSYEVPMNIKSKIDEIFYGGYCDEESTKNTISKVYNSYNYVLDTHTAVAFKVYEDYKAKTGDTRQNVILSTASPYKFTKSVYEAIYGVSNENEYELIKKLAEKCNSVIPDQISDIASRPVLHKDIINPEDMQMYITDMIG